MAWCISAWCLGTMTFGAESDEKVAHEQLDRFDGDVEKALAAMGGRDFATPDDVKARAEGLGGVMTTMVRGPVSSLAGSSCWIASSAGIARRWICQGRTTSR